MKGDLDHARAVRLVVGDDAPARVVGPLARADFVRYAGASGDFNPIHTDEEFAKSAGMPSVFGHGLLTAGLMAGYVSSWLGRTDVRRYDFRLVGQVWPGDELTLTGRVARVYEQGSEQLVDCALRVTRQTGDPVLTGTVTASLTR